MDEDTDGEPIILIVSHEELEFILGALSVLIADLYQLADTGHTSYPIV